jgi:hypothetical protein
MPDAAIDACCLIDLLVSGHAEDILRSCGHTWHLPDAVQTEVKFIRQPDTKQPGKVISVPVDLSPLLSTGLLNSCHVESPQETDLFVHYATQFRSDGEAMCLALAESRHWIMATDDRKAIRIAQQAGLTVACCPELVRQWAQVAQPDQAILTRAIQAIETFAHFRPNATMPEYQWWNNQLP